VDRELAYSGNLVGKNKRRFGLIPAVQGRLSEKLPVATGTHQIKGPGRLRQWHAREHDQR